MIDIGIRKIQRSLTTDSSGDASSDIVVNGEINKIRATCSTTGAVVTIYTLEREGSILITGDTVVDKIITNTQTFRPTIIRTSGSSSTAIHDAYSQYIADEAKIVIASGGATKKAEINIYVR